MEIVYLKDDGTIVRAYAYQSFRTGIGRWMVGDIPLDDIAGKTLYQGASLSNEAFERIIAQVRG